MSNRSEDSAISVGLLDSTERKRLVIAPDGKLMAVSMKLTETAEIGTPIVLFATHMERGGTQTGGYWHQYDVSSDGMRFLVNTLVDTAAAGPAPNLPITVNVNWTTALKK